MAVIGLSQKEKVIYTDIDLLVPEHFFPTEINLEHMRGHMYTHAALPTVGTKSY